jgi:hypothetical protein
MRRLVARCGRGRHQNLAIDDVNRAYWHVVCPEIEGRTATQIKTSMMPVASEDTVLDPNRRSINEIAGRLTTAGIRVGLTGKIAYC